MPRHLRVTGRRRRAALLAGLLLVTAGVLLDDREPAPAVRVPETTTTGTPQLYVDPAGAAAVYVRRLDRAGRTADAAIIRRISERPVATWFTDATPGFADRARRLVLAAAQAGRLPVLALYYIPQRDCANHSRGGARTADAYKKWVSALALAMRGTRALVILEPDAVPHAVRGCLRGAEARQRLALLSWAVATLRTVPGVRVYLDAGNPSWLPAARVAPALRQAGAMRAHGFALNVANFETTADNLRYGTELSRLLGGRHFVVDTSRNGNGPVRRGAGERRWCNPPGRRLGTPPTLLTGHPLADAYLWVKRPGESDGACGAGAPAAGRWYPAYAFALAR
ncbi:glycoside hydrolase family 6 protein [Actinoplanes sp. DH11]|uniref:glycoside hydrolase family 6 protein n=1 Tax=Actinoplanes sp. DH11 TaxID=2857011 RepID=UPI001E5B6BD7|nr:glycoside hydrolase family 6 protein [Actinoplanes sp. DH11]